MQTSNKVLGWAYGIVVLAIAAAYGLYFSIPAEELAKAGIALPPDLISLIDIKTFGAIAFLGLVAVLLMKAPATVVLPFATVASFFVLSVQQEPLIRYLTLSGVLFSIGMYGMISSRNAVRVLMSIELMLNAVNINLVAFARYIDPTEVKGQVFAIFILTVAAAEAAVGLAIVLNVYRNNATVDMERFNLLKW